MSNDMNLIREYTFKIVNPEPISESAIRQSMYKFREVTGYEPTVLVMHPSAYRQLLQKLDARIHTIDTIFGMNKDIEPKLGKDQWYVKKAEETTEALK